MTHFLRGERVLITGDAGAVGSNLADQLVRAGVSEIVILDNLVRGRRENLAWGSPTATWSAGGRPTACASPARSAVGRTDLMRRCSPTACRRGGVMTIHEEAAYAGTSVSLPHPEAASRDVVILPLFVDTTAEQQDYVLDRLATHVVAAAA